jgi:ABC-type bacteriocin/lantibiotic exporter with double-glycine peptidase domain
MGIAAGRGFGKCRLAAILSFGALAAITTLGGCYHGSARATSRAALEKQPGWVLVSGMTPIRQTSDNDCGAAALAMVIHRWGVASSAADIRAACPVEPGRGIAAGQLRDFARAQGLGAFLIRGEMADLVNEVGQQHPVLVGLVQRQGDKALSHYEVVAGINTASRRLFLLDPGRGAREDGYDGFLAEWEAAGRVTLVVVTAANPDRSRGPAGVVRE